MAKNAVATETIEERSETRGNGVPGMPAGATERMMEAPRGTVTVMAIFAGFIIVLWGFMYILMITRG